CALLLAGTRALAGQGAAGPRRVSLEEAAKLVGHKIYVATGSAMPVSLIPTMRRHVTERHAAGGDPTDVYFTPTFAAARNFSEEMAKAGFRTHLLFVSIPNREAATRGWAQLHRGTLFGFAKQIEKGDLAFDTVVVQVSPPDAEGMVSLGTTGDLT